MNESAKRFITGIAYITIMCLGTFYSKWSFTLLFLVISIISLHEMVKLRKGKGKTLALLYVIVPFTLIHFLVRDHQLLTKDSLNTDLILFIFILTWTFDTFAYIFGRKFGKNKIIPSISPKKSWEGLAGGYLFTIIATCISTRYILTINPKLIIYITLLLPFTATLGDLIVSYYKRKAGVKDSGKLIPGHGGMLDRMDAFIITIPVTYILNIIL